MNCVVVIPALDPEPALIPYVKELQAAGIPRIVVVNDGSNTQHAKVFRSLTSIPGVTVLHHKQNRGKGAALKTAYAHVLENGWQCAGVVTADADGQHDLSDICQIGRRLEAGEEALLLGCRDFNQPQVPRRSRMGNRVTRLVFRLLYGLCLGDTQTGLRGIPLALLPEQLQVPGERFDYEMNVLIWMQRWQVPIAEIPIATLYAGDHSSHFRTVVDSRLIVKVLLGGKFHREKVNRQMRDSYEKGRMYG